MVQQMNMDKLSRTIDMAARQIPPLWPLASHVAVNPYLGQSHLKLAEAGSLLQRVGAGPVTMPIHWYLDKYEKGEIIDSDLKAALAASPYQKKPVHLNALKQASKKPRPIGESLATIACLAAKASGIEWPGIIGDRIGFWAASHFDMGQALWTAPKGKDIWSAYRIYATHDITPEIMGLKSFAMSLAEAPDTALAAIAQSLERLGFQGDRGLESYFHQLLHTLGGWAQYARSYLWRAELAGGTDSTLVGFLAIRLFWEAALYHQYESAIMEEWQEIQKAHASPTIPDEAAILDEIWQEASERAHQRALAARLNAPASENPEERPAMQAAFCIDVRSEVFRRALESVDPLIETIGFAGFFGLSTQHRRFASDVDELRLPVLLRPNTQSCATHPSQITADTKARIDARAKRAWGRFKLAAVSSFAFVEAMGPIYILKLLRDSLGFHQAVIPNDPKPHFHPIPDLSLRVSAAENILRAMSLTTKFAPFILLIGHGANVVNNPHASGLHCGACGGYSGEVNARLLADLLNDQQIRAELGDRGIIIPQDTIFIAGLHDTTTDTITLYERDLDHPIKIERMRQIKSWLAEAGKRARAKRALRLTHAKDEKSIYQRAGDWAEVRPEWGLSGCSAFIAAPRHRTKRRDLAGRAFLHNYDWKQDQANDFRVLELIMTAPIVVASWISLQYYGSTIAPNIFGSGNKLLHNVVGGIGVVEGNGGPLRAGLPWQSIHDGKDYIHEPLRLSVCIEAPIEAMNEILKRHENLRALFDHRWLHLFALDEAGKMSWRYKGGLSWAVVEEEQVLADCA